MLLIYFYDQLKLVSKRNKALMTPNLRFERRCVKLLI